MTRYEEALKQLRTFPVQSRPTCRKCNDYGGWWVEDRDRYGPIGERWITCPGCSS